MRRVETRPTRSFVNPRKFISPTLGRSSHTISMSLGRTCAPLLLLITLCGGCAHYEYEILNPPDLRQHIGEKEVVVRADPLQYRLLAYEDHLVVQIFNPTGDVIEFLGEQSTLVDPA